MNIKDPQRVMALLDIVEKVTKVAPSYTHIISDAMEELKALNNELDAIHAKDREEWLKNEADTKAKEIKAEREVKAKEDAEAEAFRKASERRAAEGRARSIPSSQINDVPDDTFVPGTRNEAEARRDEMNSSLVTPEIKRV